MIKNLLVKQRHGFDLRVGKITRGGNGNPVFLPGKFHGQRSLVGYSPWGRKRVGHDLAHTQVYADLVADR